jgi:hypothetical protein
MEERVKKEIEVKRVIREMMVIKEIWVYRVEMVRQEQLDQ